jgi:alkanesulfonate monooxygenase SsuD/methylene tetrahydromethanopterin reductase-like flavin-dependent oxidoreductase (luciferase family)
MKYGFVFPGGEARAAAEFAYQGEIAGWDGFFVWEPVWGVDAWVSLAAAAMRTERIRLGTMITPLSRMRPWKLASETATLDRLSNGRVILSVGLGALDSGFEAFGEVTDRRTRAELLDEGLEILIGLWHGQPFKFQGKHYRIKPTKFQVPPPPVQQPRIPIWVVGAWPSRKSMDRALRYDGLLPNVLGEDGKVRMASPTPEDVRDMRAYIQENRAETTSFDIVVEGQTPGEDPERAIETVRPYAEAGATWWIEAMWEAGSLDEVLERIRQGPPNL